MLMILYVLAGFLLAIPYCLLAGWSTENFPMVAFVAPAFLCIWFMLASIAGVIGVARSRKIYFDWRAALNKSDQQRLPGALSFFWVWTLYSFLPIILHWGAALLKNVGYETVGSLLNTHRYASTLYVFMAILMLAILVGVFTSAWDTAKKVWIQFVHR